MRTGKAGGLLHGADVGEKFDGVCASETPEEAKLKIRLLSSEIHTSVLFLHQGGCVEGLNILGCSMRAQVR